MIISTPTTDPKEHKSNNNVNNSIPQNVVIGASVVSSTSNGSNGQLQASTETFPLIIQKKHDPPRLSLKVIVISILRTPCLSFLGVICVWSLNHPPPFQKLFFPTSFPMQCWEGKILQRSWQL